MSQEEAKLLNCHWHREPGDAEIGELNGQPVRVDEVEDTLPMDDWPNVIVTRANGDKIRPWRHVYGI